MAVKIKRPNIVPSPWGSMASGRYYGNFLSGYVSTVAIILDNLYAVPFILGKRTAFDRIWCEVTTLAAGNARLGIYADNGKAYPSKLILDAGTVSTGTTGVKEITIAVTLPPGLYWLVIVSDASPTIAAVSVYTSSTFILGHPGTASAPYTAMLLGVAFTYAALPDPYPGGATYKNDLVPMLLMLRRA